MQKTDEKVNALTETVKVYQKLLEYVKSQILKIDWIYNYI